MKRNLKIVWLCSFLLASLAFYGCKGKANTVSSEPAVASAVSGKEVIAVDNKNLAGIGIEYCGA
jgi:hypothetical protein